MRTFADIPAHVRERVRSGEPILLIVLDAFGRVFLEHGLYEWAVFEPSLQTIINPLPFRLAGTLDPRRLPPSVHRLPAMSLVSTLTVQVLKFHHGLYVRSGGRIGQGWLGVPCLLLTTVGAKSGLTRVNSLNYAEDGEGFVLVASNGGARRSPAWYFNLRKDPSVTAQVGTRKLSATARIVERGEPDYDRLWKLANARNRNRYDATSVTPTGRSRSWC